MAGITTKALFMRIVPAGGGKEFTVERWKKLPDTEAARKEYNAVEFSDDFYERHPDRKAVIYNRDLLDDMIMREDANNVADGGDYIKFKSDQHEQGLIDLSVMRGVIEKYRDPSNRHPVVPSNPVTREPLTRKDIALIMNEQVMQTEFVISDSRQLPGYIDKREDEYTVIIPEGVTQIGKDAFSWCRGLTNVTIPEGVIKIEENAFAGCSGLENISIPESVTVIGDFAFEECDGLTSVTIPEGVTVIARGVFANCDGLTSVTIPEGVTKIGVGAFYGCSGLRSVRIPETVTQIGDAAFARSTTVIRT